LYEASIFQSHTT
jgi:hypothetical protein